MTPLGSPGNAARRLVDVRLLSGLSLAAANFFLWGRRQRGLRAGQAAAAPWAAWSSAQMGAAGWRRVDTAPLFWGCTIGNPQHVLRGRGSASLDVSFPARSCWAKLRSFYLPPWVLYWARELQNARILQTSARPGWFAKRFPAWGGRGGGSGPESGGWRLHPDCTWRHDGGGGGSGHAGGCRCSLAQRSLGRFLRPSPRPGCSKQGSSAGACRARLSV